MQSQKTRRCICVFRVAVAGNVHEAVKKRHLHRSGMNHAQISVACAKKGQRRAVPNGAKGKVARIGERNCVVGGDHHVNVNQIARYGGIARGELRGYYHVASDCDWSADRSRGSIIECDCDRGTHIRLNKGISQGGYSLYSYAVRG